MTDHECTVSVIIPVYNGGTNFRHCLSSLTQVVTPSTEIIVVADGDTDGSSLVAEEFGLKVIKLPISGGPGRARNLGAWAAKGDIIFFVDADVVISQKAISQVQRAFDAQPDLAAVIGSYDDAPGASNFLSQYKNLFHHYTHQKAREEASTFWGACGAIRREIFLSIGGFDESYRRPSIEDIELGSRLKAAGYKIRLCKDLQVKHLKYWDVFSLLKAELFYRAIPWTELIWRSRNLSNDLNLELKSRLSTLIVYILLCSLVVVWWHPAFFAVVLIASLFLLKLNSPVYYFFHNKRGFWFALTVIPWHWFYYTYCGFAFAFGTAKYFWSELVASKLTPNSVYQNKSPNIARL
ncbi:putative glycosyltransferase [Rivularia sp. PCC 7116]|uniref:glycosyltransferase n=1 Tax=Rivularia sp. PCC 7116 TaxID=373994 RepID=UPI00029F1461|nr:glycosyltransferase family 2 protein [Rivularia sp. PCC 7116]AFY59002.1 putative glycosyltransferase [Rivularia sp. PCC 7116]